jgi:restriction system protein
MSIWTYADNSRFPRELAHATACPYCSTTLALLLSEHRKGKSHSEDYDELKGFVCQTCGWWKAIQDTGLWGRPNNENGLSRFVSQKFCQVGSLKNLDLTNVKAPLDEVRSFLLARYESRFSINPYLLENTVGAVFGSLGYDFVVTSRSNDGGIDVILRKEYETIGVQVKRYKDSISVEQIRELTGALIDNNMTKGIFVTTSSFQSGAYSMSRRLKAKGYAIELMDAERFYDALKLAQRPQYSSKEEFLASHDLSDMPKIGGFDGY